MSKFSNWRESRKPAEFTYEPPKMTTAGEAMLRHLQFVNTCTALDLSVARTEGSRITVTGRRRNIDAFARRMAVTR